MINREHSYEIMEEIIEHWSPRAFDPNKEISKEELMAILEAARFAPSCFNEQPWSYVVGHDQEEKSKVLSVLAPSNQEWAKNASALLIILSHKQFKHNNKDNRWNQFDAGTAWGYLALEAQRRGVITHAMGGFSVDKARDVFNIPEEYDVIAALAVGYMGDLEVLSKENQEREKPSERKPLEDLIFNK